MQLSSRLNQFSEYIFSILNKKVAEVEKKSGRHVLSLAIGSPDFPPSALYINKLKKYISESGSHLYPGYGAIPEFTKAMQFWYGNRFDVQIKEGELYPLLGGKDGVGHLPFALLDEEDEVLVPDPGYPAFSGSALMIGAKPVYYNLTEANNFKIDIKDLEKKINSKTKFIWVNFPSNPTGQVAIVEELIPIVDFAKKHQIWLIYDNAYSEITFDGFVAPSILQINRAKDIAVEIGSFSKTFSFAGFRTGWIVGNSQIIIALAKIKSQIDSGLSRPLQKLAGYALTHFDKKWQQKMLRSYENRCDILLKHLKKLGLCGEKPKGSLYLWLKIPDSYCDSEKFSFDLLETKQILVTPGTAFGENGKRYIRVSFSSNITNIDQYF